MGRPESARAPRSVIQAVMLDSLTRASIIRYAFEDWGPCRTTASYKAAETTKTRSAPADAGDRALFISGLCLTALHGHDMPDLSIDDLLAHATADRFLHRHRWRPGDIVMWDNIRVLHRAAALPPGTTRVLHRTTTAGAPPIPAHTR